MGTQAHTTTLLLSHVASKNLMFFFIPIKNLHVFLYNIYRDIDGTVHRVVERATGRRFMARSMPRAQLEQLYHQLRMFNYLMHPNIASVHDALIDGDTGWIIYER